jgi:hypothetical protein
MANASDMYRAEDMPHVVRKFRGAASFAVNFSPDGIDEDDFANLHDVQKVADAWPDILELLTDLEQCGPDIPHFDRIRQLIVQLECH